MWVCWEGSEECGRAGREVRSVGVLGGSEECWSAGRGVRSLGDLDGV